MHPSDSGFLSVWAQPTSREPLTITSSKFQGAVLAGANAIITLGITGIVQHLVSFVGL
jgi:hypothetical protein